MNFRYILSNNNVQPNQFEQSNQSKIMVLDLKDSIELLRCYTSNQKYQKCLEKYPINKEKCYRLEAILQECLNDNKIKQNIQMKINK